MFFERVPLSRMFKSRVSVQPGEHHVCFRRQMLVKVLTGGPSDPLKYSLCQAASRVCKPSNGQGADPQNEEEEEEETEDEDENEDEDEGEDEDDGEIHACPMVFCRFVFAF